MILGNTISFSNSTSWIPQFGRRSYPQTNENSSSSVEPKYFSISAFREKQILEENFLEKQRFLLAFRFVLKSLVAH